MIAPMERYYRMVENIAKTFENRVDCYPDTSLEDIRQIGYMSLIRSYERVDETYTQKQVTTFLKNSIQGDIQNFFRSVLNRVYGRTMAEKETDFWRSFYDDKKQTEDAHKQKKYESIAKQYPLHTWQSSIFFHFVSKTANHDSLDDAVTGYRGVTETGDRLSAYDAIPDTYNVSDAMSTSEDDMVNQIDVDRILSILTPEEQDILWLPYCGYSDREIAAKIGLSHSSIGNRRQTIRRRCFHALHHPDVIATT